MTETFATTVIAVSVLLAMVLLTRRAVARHFGPRAAYALWLLPAARLFMPSITLPSGWFPNLTPATQPAPPMPTGVWRAVAVPPDTPSAFVTAAEAPDIILPVLISIWIIGIAVGLIWALRSQRMQARHVRQTTVTAPNELRSDIDRAARLSGLSKTPNIRMSTQNDGPLVGGLVRPVIVLPKDFMTQFTPTQRRLALLHEMTHLRRGDLWTATAMLAFRLVSWPNPLIHWAWPRFRADQEAACDASVLRRVGETARADYAETLLTAAKTDIKTTGRAARVPGTGLTLSLHHPIKERLMTLGSNTNKKHGATRWALASLLLAGTAISAPLSMADDQAAPTPPTAAEAPSEPKITTNKTMRVFVSTDADSKGYEVREVNGVKTYLRVSRDGTTETLTKEELEAEYGVDFDKIANPPHPPLPLRLDGEPGLRAMVAPHLPRNIQKTVIVRKSDDAEDGSYEIKIENDVKRAFRIDEDGTRTEVDIDEIGQIADIDVEVMGGAHAFAFPALPDGQKRLFLNSDEDMSFWVDGDETGENIFTFNASGVGGSEARLRSAKSMIEATDRMIASMREDADGAADKDLRNAERELEKARKALEKAMEAVRKSEER